MAGGWSRDGAVQEQIDASIDEAVASARSHIKSGESLANCEECEVVIPETRRKAVLGVRLCISCQQELEMEHKNLSSYNRRGSKNSQLK
jgi:phage/conjugal plasmid C-4 type zinc finger TraR family protein